MALTVKKLNLWRCEKPNQAGSLREALEPVAAAGCDLQVVMGYRLPESRQEAAIEIFPVKGKKGQAAATAAGFRPAGLPCLLVTGPNRVGLGHDLAQRLSGAGININFLVTQVLGRQFTSVMGFDSDADASAAAKHVQAVGRTKAPAPKKKAAPARKAKKTRR
jgi:hypothetical protein